MELEEFEDEKLIDAYLFIVLKPLYHPTERSWECSNDEDYRRAEEIGEILVGRGYDLQSVMDEGIKERFK